MELQTRKAFQDPTIDIKQIKSELAKLEAYMDGPGSAFGAGDTEPRAVVAAILYDLRNNKYYEIKSSAKFWQLFDKMPGVGLIADDLTMKMATIRRMLMDLGRDKCFEALDQLFKDDDCFWFNMYLDQWESNND